MEILDCAPAQDISPKPGYIPVYIRNGNTPLEDINPDLAEAFDIYAYKHYKLDLSKLNRRLNNSEGVSDDENVILGRISDVIPKSNIQRIPRT